MLPALVRSCLSSSSSRVSFLSGNRFVSSFPNVIKPTRAERLASKLGEHNLELAVRSLHEDGLVVVSNVIPFKEIDHLNTKMVKDARKLQSRGESGPFNYNIGNVQQDPPPTGEFFHPSIFLNPIAAQVTTSILGPKPKWTFCSGNSAMPPLPGAEPQRQPVHSDADFAHPSHPFALVVNVPLIDFTPKNGSTEVWLGTHTGELAGLQVQDGAHGERASGKIKEKLVEKRKEVRGPSQPEIAKGSIIIRDLRLWHAGMPNFTQDVRVMLAMIHFAPWYRNPMRLELADTIKPMVEEQTMLDVPADWIQEYHAAARYLDRGFGNSYDFNQSP